MVIVDPWPFQDLCELLRISLRTQDPQVAAESFVGRAGGSRSRAGAKALSILSLPLVKSLAGSPVLGGDSRRDRPSLDPRERAVLCRCIAPRK